MHYVKIDVRRPSARPEHRPVDPEHMLRPGRLPDHDEPADTVIITNTSTGPTGTAPPSDAVRRLRRLLRTGQSYQIDVRSVGYAGIDAWIIDIRDQERRPDHAKQRVYMGSAATSPGLHHLLRWRLTSASSITASGPGNATTPHRGGHRHR